LSCPSALIQRPPAPIPQAGLKRTRSVRVLMVTNMWPHGLNPTYGIFVKRQVDSLTSMGLECDVLFIEGHRSRWAYPRAALRLLLLNWARDRPSVVHGHGGETSLVVRWFARGPVVVSYCGDDLLGTPRADGSIPGSSRMRRFLLRHLARWMSATITKSAEMERTLGPAARQSNVVIPNGVDRELFHPRPLDQARRDLGWSPNERVVLFAADPAVERKRYWLAQAACREAERVVGTIRLEVATGLAPDEMPRLMAAADCLLLTSAIEGSPNVVKEAVACSLPVVCTDVGDVDQVLANVDPSAVCGADPSELGAALADCLTVRRRSNGWEQSSWLSDENIAQRLLDLYRKLAPADSPTNARA
jgi:teichuronic acid biosynthesis glycosyltransferase TuaC